MARDKDRDKRVKGQFDKAGEGKDESSAEVPLWVQMSLFAQIFLARLLTQKQIPESQPLVRGEQGNPMEQLHSGNFRFYSPAELDRLLEIARQLKDVVQTNCVAMGSLGQATVKTDDPHAAELCKKMNEMGGAPLIDSETALGAYVLWAAQIESFRKSARVLYKPRPNEEKLPVVDCERQLVLDVAQSLARAYANMNSLQQKIATATPVLNIPQIDRINREYDGHTEGYQGLSIEIMEFVQDSIGYRPPAPLAIPLSAGPAI